MTCKDPSGSSFRAKLGVENSCSSLIGAQEPSRGAEPEVTSLSSGNGIVYTRKSPVVSRAEGAGKCLLFRDASGKNVQDALYPEESRATADPMRMEEISSASTTAYAMFDARREFLCKQTHFCFTELPAPLHMPVLWPLLAPMVVSDEL